MTKEETTPRDARLYEVAFLIVPTVSEEELPKEVDAITKAVKAAGTIVKEGETKPLNLAYEMRTTVGNKIARFKSAYFGFMYFEADPSSVSALKETLTKNEQILRFLIVKPHKGILLPKKAKKPQTVDKETVQA